MSLDLLTIREGTGQDVSEDSYSGASSTVDFSNRAIVQKDVDSDYKKLDGFLSHLVKGNSVSNRRIDEFYNSYSKIYAECTKEKLPSIHSYHPLAVIMVAMDYGFMIDYCMGSVPHMIPSPCRKVKANGMWVALPEDLEKKVSSYLIKNKPSSGICPQCLEIYSAKEVKATEDKDM
jgi:hypothetical protein